MFPVVGSAWVVARELYLWYVTSLPPPLRPNPLSTRSHAFCFRASRDNAGRQFNVLPVDPLCSGRHVGVVTMALTNIRTLVDDGAAARLFGTVVQIVPAKERAEPQAVNYIEVILDADGHVL